MKLMLAALALVSASAFAKTEPIVDTTTLTCDEAQEAVQRNEFQTYTTDGKPVLPHDITYWKNADYCGHVGYAKNSHGPLKATFTAVKTKDVKHCFIGYVCSLR